MKNIIVTVADKPGRFQYDMEVSVGQPGRQLAEDMMEVLNGQNPELYLDTRYHCLYLNRLGRILSEKETLAEAGIRNGDYITIVSRV